MHVCVVCFWRCQRRFLCGRFYVPYVNLYIHSFMFHVCIKKMPFNFVLISGVSGTSFYLALTEP